MNGLFKTTSGPLGPTATLRNKNGLVGNGHHLLTGAEERISTSKTPYLHVVLENAGGRMTGSIWPEHRHRIELPGLYSVVSVAGSVVPLGTRTHLNIECLAPATVDDVTYATDLLPRHRCPEKALSGLDALTALERTLPAPLDGFLKRVLLDPAIGLPFLRCRASVRHHHAFEGGLLAHSTEMLDTAAVLARRVLPDDPTAPAMAQVGLLLHDLGKLRTVGETRRPQGALAVRHEFITIELLASHLRWLEREDFEPALGLRHILSHLATPKKARSFGNYGVAEIIERLDELSAASHNSRGLEKLIKGDARRASMRSPAAAVSATPSRRPTTSGPHL